MFSKVIKTINGDILITIPSRRDEITLGMLFNLTPEPGYSYSPLEQLSILSGVPLESDTDVCLYDVRNMKDIEVFNDTLTALAGEIAAFKEVQEIPKHVTFTTGVKHTRRMFSRKTVKETVTVPVITDLGIEPAGAYMEAKSVIKDDLEEWKKHNPEQAGDITLWNPKIATSIRLLALYFHSKVLPGQRFNSRAAIDFESVVRQLPITEALPIARHFFLSYPNLSKPKVKPSLAVALSLK